MTTSPACKNIPASVLEQIKALRHLETELGHLPPENLTVKELSERVHNNYIQKNTTSMERQTEILFAQICEELSLLQWSVSEIVQAINTHVCYAGGPSYCDEAQVADTLGL